MDLDQAKRRVMSEYIGEPEHVETLIRIAQQQWVAERRALAETLRAVDFPRTITRLEQVFLGPGRTLVLTRAAEDALIAAVVTKTLSEVGL